MRTTGKPFSIDKILKAFISVMARRTPSAARAKLADWGGGGGAREIEHQPHAMSQPSDLTIFRASRINNLSRRCCSLASAVKWPCR